MWFNKMTQNREEINLTINWTKIKPYKLERNNTKLENDCSVFKNTSKQIARGQIWPKKIKNNIYMKNWRSKITNASWKKTQFSDYVMKGILNLSMLFNNFLY